MVKVTLNGVTLAESDETIVVENNHYFPPSAIKKDLFHDSETHTVCGWKGTASYYDVKVGEKTVSDAAWYYPTTSDKAKNIEGWIAFYKTKVTIE